jgi:hypothetical protein
LVSCGQPRLGWDSLASGPIHWNASCMDRRIDQDRAWVCLIQPADRYVITLRRGMVDGLIWHSSLGTNDLCGFAALRELIFQPFTTREIPSLITSQTVAPEKGDSRASRGGAATLPPPPSSNRTGRFPASGLPENCQREACTRISGDYRNSKPRAWRWA